MYKVINTHHASIHGLGRVTSESFGDIYTGFTTPSNHAQESDEYFLGSVRWPGGTMAESKFGQAFYDLGYPEVFVGPIFKGLTATIARLIEEQRGFSMIVPTFPTYDQGGQPQHGGLTGAQEQALDKFGLELYDFLDHLTKIDSYYDNALQYLGDGYDFTLEIGNETSFLGYASWSYGVLAHRALEVFSDHKEAQEYPNLQVAVQMGVNQFSNKLIINNLDGKTSNNTGGSDFGERKNLLGVIDKLVSHTGLVKSAKEFDYIEEKSIIEDWKEALGDRWGEVELYASAWGVGMASHSYLDLIELRDSALLKGNDIGARQGASTIDVFSKLISLGYDAAALWGTVDPVHNASSYQRLTDGVTWHGSGPKNDAELSHGGEVLRLMAETLPGTVLLTGNLTGLEDWNAEYFDPATGIGSGEVNVYSYSSDSFYVLFASVTDIDGYQTSFEGKLDYEFNVSQLEGVSEIYYEAVMTEFDLQGWKDFKDANANNIGYGDLIYFRRLFEVPSIKTGSIELRPDGTFSYQFSNDFETVRFLLERADLPGVFDKGMAGPIINEAGIGGEILTGEDNSDRLGGTERNDLLDGGMEDDLLGGSAGKDQIFGREGHDLIFGDAGDDEIYGGHGNDQLYGGDGDDVMRGESGQEFMHGGAGDDWIDGGRGDDALHGASGDDTMHGGLDNDKLLGGIGHDFLSGGDGNDLLRAGDGDDTLVGGAGDDIIYGDLGSDVFVFFDGFGSDMICDFDATDDSERIDFSDVSGIENFSDLISNHTRQDKNNIIIEIDKNFLELYNNNILDLDEDDFVF